MCKQDPMKIEIHVEIHVQPRELFKGPGGRARDALLDTTVEFVLANHHTCSLQTRSAHDAEGADLV